MDPLFTYRPINTENDSDKKNHRGYDLSLIGISFFAGLVVAAIALSAFDSAKAEVDTIGQVKIANSESYDVLHDVGEALRGSIEEIDYVKAQLHENNVKLAF